MHKQVGGSAVQFPVYIPLGTLHLQPHVIFLSLAYLLGYQVYSYLRARWGDEVPDGGRARAIAGAVVGGAIGSKLLYWFEDPAMTLAHLTDLGYLMAGKSMVGALLGGLVGVELVKRRMGERRSTGDLFAIPLCVGMAIGRIGCFLTGLADGTHGIATALPWGVDFGDGIARHPTQLYEVVALGLIALWCLVRRRTARRSGDQFRGFMLLYLGFRLLIDFIKPDPHIYFGLSAIQVASLAGLIYYVVTSLLTSSRTRRILDNNTAWR